MHNRMEDEKKFTQAYPEGDALDACNAYDVIMGRINQIEDLTIFEHAWTKIEKFRNTLIAQYDLDTVKQHWLGCKLIAHTPEQPCPKIDLEGDDSILKFFQDMEKKYFTSKDAE